MKLTSKLWAVALAVSLSACAGMTTQQRNTAVGAAVGGAAGYVVSDGNAGVTLGGAALGGVVGSQIK